MGGGIQINNADNKNATVSKLVILRACLYDIYRDVRNLNYAHDGNKQCDKRRTDLRANIDSLMAQNDKKQYQTYYANKKDAIKREEKGINSNFDWSIPLYVGIVCAILSAIIFTALILSGVIMIPIARGDGEMFLNFQYPNCETFFDYVLMFVLGLLTGVAMGIGFGLASILLAAICFFIGDLIKCRRDRRREKNKTLQGMKKVQAEEDEYFKKSGAYDQMVAQNNKKIEELRYKIKTENESITANNNKIRELQKAIPRKWNSCVRVFSGVIHNSDFESVDYLLYLFITGRADTTKEALQLLDEAKRTSAIIGAINNAATYLASNFTSALNAFRNDVVKELRTINSSINSMHGTLNGIREDIQGVRGDLRQVHDDLICIQNSVDMNTVATMSFAVSTREMLSEINRKTTSWQYVNGELVAR